MFRKAIISVLLILPSVAFAQLTDCSRFREGKFRVADTEAGVITIAERKGLYQTESSESLKLMLRFRISWQDNCSFTLRLDKVLRNENKIDIPSGMEVRVKILETAADTYTQEISSSLTNHPYKVQATKIN
ncbi:MAG: hypothetical protein IPP96_10100 [Chitinophagaceae bacterium]|nr:hypothetical protein [Chitinophagaceae bacterium]